MITCAIVIQIVHLLYHQAVTLFDFFPFNGARFSSQRERVFEAGFNFVVMAIPPVGFSLRWPGLMEAGVICNVILLAGECATWWVPYFFGPSPKWLEIYSKVQDRTITVIPRRGTNPVPNLEHLILMALTALTTVFSWMAFRSVQGAFSRYVWIGWVVGVLVFCAAVYQCSLAGRKKPGAAAVRDAGENQ